MLELSQQDLKYLNEMKVPVLKKNINYWLVRTNGGIYFNDFHLNNYVAIGWDEIKDSNLMVEERRDDLIDKLKKEHKYDGNDEQEDNKKISYSLIATQLIRFCSEMKKGDIVIIPSENSKYIALGEIEDEQIYIEELDLEELEKTECPYIKRRKIKWIMYQKKKEVDIYLYRLLNSHHAITDANDYSTFIDRTLYPFYIKENKAHFTLKVKQTRNISAMNIITFMSDALKIIDEFNEKSKSSLNKENIDLRINVNSPGPIEFFGNIDTILVLGICLMGIVGGGFKFKKTKETTEGEIKTDGIIEKIIKFIDHRHENKMDELELEYKIKESANKLKIEVPKLANIDSIKISDCTEIQEDKENI
ncbi:hypothetical protein EXM36_02785 [Clostridium botulinum]|uniref:hypothetical protein n=2 Tax=Clostridium botulinum TaxID=1491 RepID=UPI00137635BE|nr:hypothetical protein [Clostridium botulinum]NCI18621.1 hypothetical protein [Clostridium botulinum]NCI36933.1 hypothetical protein [Clostridium botulinum]NCI72971.1 hypothetical protein [Clostridium botulinum]NDI40640.1 hypothetical protein [Clostridium botulinum]NEZ70242.1 hypothetical protein [Clostridium botulinum]